MISFSIKFNSLARARSHLLLLFESNKSKDLVTPSLYKSFYILNSHLISKFCCRYFFNFIPSTNSSVLYEQIVPGFCLEDLRRIEPRNVYKHCRQLFLTYCRQNQNSKNQISQLSSSRSIERHLGRAIRTLFF